MKYGFQVGRRYIVHLSLPELTIVFNLPLFFMTATLNINTGKQTKQVKSNYTTLPLKQPVLYVRQVDTYELLGFWCAVEHFGVDLHFAQQVVDQAGACADV